MQQADFDKLAAWFDQLAECDEAQRQVQLRELEAQDPGLAEALKKMLKDKSPADAFFAPLETELEEADDAMEGRLVSGYRIGELLGRGGMGSVHRATREGEAFSKDFAIKILPGAGHSQQHRRRFLLERKILASLNHPAIASLVDGGLLEDQTPFIVMEYIDGKTLLQFCVKRNLSLTERIRLFIQVCEAVDYAHRQLVIHRDLKPENILVTEGGQAKLLDFGIAKLQQETGGGDLTGTLQRVLTPDYASPEQIRGESLTPATDIYSLGIVLYELLTHQRPYRFKGRTSGEIQDIMARTSPTKPSSMLVKNLQEAENPAPTWQSKLRGELDTIVLKALRKEPDQRYPSAAALAEDLRRYLSNEPIRAKKPTWSYLAWKFVKRYRTAVVLVSLIMLSLMVGLIATTNQAQRAAKARDQAEQAAEKATQLSQFLIQLFENANAKVNQGKALTLNEAIDKGREQFQTELDLNPSVRAGMHGVFGRIYFLTGEYTKAEEELSTYRGLEPEPTETAMNWFENMAFLGETLIFTAKYDEAKTLLTSLRGQSEISGETLTVGITESLLGLVALRQGETDQAEAHFLKAETILRETQHRDAVVELGFALNNLGNLYLETRDLEKAQTKLEQARDLLRHRPADLLGIVANLGVVHTRMGRFDEAIKTNLEVIELKKQIHGETAPVIANSYQNLAQTYLQAGDYEKSEAAFTQAADLYGQEPESMYPAFPKVGLSKLRLLQGRFEEALSLCEEGLALIQRYQPPESYVIANVRLHYSDCFLKMERYEASAEQSLAAWGPLLKTFGPDHPLSKRALELLEIVSKETLSAATQGKIDEILK